MPKIEDLPWYFMELWQIDYFRDLLFCEDDKMCIKENGKKYMVVLVNFDFDNDNENTFLAPLTSEIFKRICERYDDLRERNKKE